MTSLRVVLVLVGVSSVGGARPQTRPAKQVSSDIDYNGVPRYLREKMERLELMYTTEDFARKYGYPFETHTVTTEDGYLLTVHRIPGSPKAATLGAKGPVLLMHGLTTASDIWLLAGPERGLGFILADEGYDVWMGNIRGNTYSKKHKTLLPTDYNYFNYSLHELGVYDLPTFIDFTLKKTDQKKLIYIGFSLGTSMFLILTSMRPEYNEKFRLSVLLAPGVYGTHSSPGRIALPYANTMFRNMANNRVGKLSPPSSTGAGFPIMAYEMCGDGQPFQQLCKFVYFNTFGYNNKELNSTLLASIVAHGSSGASVQVVYHIAQIAQTERFQMFDRNWGRISKQPEYDLSKITAPVSLHYALNDLLIPSRGVILLSKRLKNVVNLAPVPDNQANHMDFVFAIHVKQLVYNKLLGILKKF